MGFEVERFRGEVDSDLICSFCNKVLEEAVVGSCGHPFCQECLKKYLARKRDECPVCQADLSKREATAPTEELIGKLESLSMRCSNQKSGCEAILEYFKLDEHLEKECPLRPVPCRHKNCPDKVPCRTLETHMEKCDYRLVECKVCRVCLPRKDMPAHQAVKRCFEQLNKRRMVKSARKVSQELKEHRVVMTHQRHLTEQTERSMLRNHYFQDRARYHQRSMSAGPVLMRSSIEARVGSAMVTPHNARTLKSAVLDTCMSCTGKFTQGRHTSARRHTHNKCDHCQTWRMWNGPRGWASVPTS